MIAREKKYNKLEKYSQMEQESWNRLNRSELWSGTDGADWTGTKYFSVDKDTNDIFINPKGVKALIDFYHEKAANQASIDKSTLPKATILTCSTKMEKSTSSEGYLRSICTPEAREKYKGTTQVFFIEEGGSHKNHNETSHTRCVLVKYSQSITFISLDSTPDFNENLKRELKLLSTDQLFLSTVPLQTSSTGCKTFALKIYKQFLDELANGTNIVDEICKIQRGEKSITYLPEGIGRLAQDSLVFKNQEEISRLIPSLKSTTNHTYDKTGGKHMELTNGTVENKAIYHFSIKSIIKLKKIGLKSEETGLALKPSKSKSTSKVSTPTTRQNNWNSTPNHNQEIKKNCTMS